MRKTTSSIKVAIVSLCLMLSGCLSVESKLYKSARNYERSTSDILLEYVKNDESLSATRKREIMLDVKYHRKALKEYEKAND